ncbi:MAG: MOSC domain-containing protein [Candidatus Bipolaricaulota bacterium]
MQGTLISINVSEKKGEIKKPRGTAKLVQDYGIADDAHAGAENRQVSLLDRKEIHRLETESGMELRPGEFAENLTTENLNIKEIKLGMMVTVGSEVLLQVSQIGKECHEGCPIKEKTGRCIMPDKGIFLKVLKGGRISVGDAVNVQVGNES